MEDFAFSDEEFDFLLKIAQNYQSSENERRKVVESKASVFIGAFAVATTIMLSLAKDLISSDTSSVFYFPNIILVVATIIYLCRTITFSICCLSRKYYKHVGFPFYLFSNANANQKKKTLLLDIINAIYSNQNIINDKYEQMVMAQKYFLRAVACVGILSVMLLIESILKCH
jgi:hypothetical protein